MKFKGATKPLLARYTQLREAQDAAFHAIFKAAIDYTQRLP